jgi:acyl-coenzyme A synthetase/AMP-(fatty) acid ligase
MVPALLDLREGALPRNPNGKIDRTLLRASLASLSLQLFPAP